MADQELCLLTVHAHPDDEASKGAGTVARARAEGIKTVLVCCTGGEAGDILNPAMDSDEVRANLFDVRMQELRDSVEIIGYDELVLLGYRDSGMPDTEPNKDPRSFAQAELGEAVGRLVAVIRAHRPQVIVTYDEEQSRYPHPDHLRVHEISVLAFDAAGDPDSYPELGEPWQPLKLYYSSWSWKRSLAMHQRMLELGIESPFDAERIKWLEESMNEPDRNTTAVDISEFADVRSRALLAHRTQVDPNNRMWFGLPEGEERTIHPYDDYILARSLVDSPVPEDDLFARHPDHRSPVVTDGPVRLRVVVTGTVDGDRSWLVTVEELGARAVEGGAEDPHVTVTSGRAEADALASGELAPAVAFMQGRLKMAGDNAAWLQVLPVLGAEAWQPA